MNGRDLSTETRPLPGEVVVGSDEARIRFSDRREMIHPYDRRVFFAVELTAPTLTARLDNVTNFADGHALVDFLAAPQPDESEWISADRDLAVRTSKRELTWRIGTDEWAAEVTTPFEARLVEELKEFLVVPEPVDTGVIREAGLWGARAAERAALGAHMSTPAWESALDLTRIKPGMTVLDLACGSGEFCGLAAERGALATGIDASTAMIDLARQQAPRAEFHLWPLGKLPWEDNSFDVVTAFNALFFAPDPEAAFEEAVRVSRHEVVVCEWHPELTSDLMTVGQAVRGPSGRRRTRLPESQEKLTIEIPVEHPDVDAMLRAMLTVGTYQTLIASVGEETVAERIKAEAEPFRTADGGYRFANYYLLQIFRK